MTDQYPSTPQLSAALTEPVSGINAMTSNADNSLNPQFWNITFVGGTADFEGEDIAPLTAPPPHGAPLPLAMTGVGDRVRVASIKGGHRMVRRLTDLGIVQGSEITVVSRMESGSVIVALQGCRIGLGAGMAHRVMVTLAQ
jgi:ferrous iron transport protein A